MPQISNGGTVLLRSCKSTEEPMVCQKSQNLCSNTKWWTSSIVTSQQHLIDVGTTSSSPDVLTASSRDQWPSGTMQNWPSWLSTVSYIYISGHSTLQDPWMSCQHHCDFTQMPTRLRPTPNDFTSWYRVNAETTSQRCLEYLVFTV